VPVARADNKDGPRLMCGLGLGPVTHGYPRFFRYAYFEYVQQRACLGREPYPSSQLLPAGLLRQESIELQDHFSLIVRRHFRGVFVTLWLRR
jgi:hypothetical protein